MEWATILCFLRTKVYNVHMSTVVHRLYIHIHHIMS